MESGPSLKEASRLDEASRLNDASRSKDALRARAKLFVEDFQHGFILGMVHLRQSFLHQRTVLKVGGVEHLVQAEGGVVEENLGVLEALVVVGHGEVNFLGHGLDFPEQGVGLI